MNDVQNQSLSLNDKIRKSQLMSILHGDRKFERQKSILGKIDFRNDEMSNC